MKKLVMILIALTFMCTSSFSGEQPEFDTVGCDATNYFNDVVKNLVVASNTRSGLMINHYSDFIQEIFSQTAGQPTDDICFPGYKSHLTTAGNSGEYSWTIVIQKKPDTDLDINIRDCVVKMNSQTPFGSNPFEGASQTGRFVLSNGQVIWMMDANPRISATAYPGEFPTNGFPVQGFVLDARTTPDLMIVPLQDRLFTSKGVWEESIVVVMPETGGFNALGYPTYRLKQGDRIKIDIALPPFNTVDARYGADNVSIKYVGIHGTEYLAPSECSFGSTGS